MSIFFELPNSFRNNEVRSRGVRKWLVLNTILVLISKYRENIDIVSISVAIFGYFNFDFVIGFEITSRAISILILVSKWPQVQYWYWYWFRNSSICKFESIFELFFKYLLSKILVSILVSFRNIGQNVVITVSISISISKWSILDIDIGIDFEIVKFIISILVLVSK